jgi:hypothetical protein
MIISKNHFSQGGILSNRNSVNLFLLLAALISMNIFCFISPEETVPDTIAPVISLSVKTDTILIGERWVNPTVSATDNVDKDISSQIVISGNVHNEYIGVYKLYYSVSDRAGNSSFDTLTVHVIADPLTAAYYPFTGDTKDYSGNSLDGTITGRDSLTTDRFGLSGNARYFKGSYLDVAYTSKLDFSGAFSACAWAKSTDSLQAYRTNEGFIFDMGYGAERDYGIYVHSTSGISFRYNSKIIANANVDIQKWHHYALVFTGDTLKAYIDGTLTGTVSCGTGSIDNNPFRVGCESKQAQRYWNGCIDDVLLVNCALSNERISELVHAGRFKPDSSSTTTDTGVVKDTSTSTQNLKATISGSSGSLSLKLTWDAVPGALGYGVYYNTGKTVTKNDYYRIASTNSKTFSSELTEGTEYTFAIVSFVNDVESSLSQPVTVIFK